MPLARQVLTVAFALAAVGCSNESPTLDYSVTIDSAFTIEERGSIVAGLDEWRGAGAVPALHLDVTIGRCGMPAPHYVCFQPAHDPPNPSVAVIGVTTPGGSGDANVLLYVDRIQAMAPDMRPLTAQTAAHEMGHAMGLKHTSAGELMAARVADQAQAVTAKDVDQFWAVRGQ